MARPISVLELTPEDKQALQHIARGKTTSQRDGLRARIVLRRAEGTREAEVARALGVSITTVSTWSRRFELQGLEGLRDRPGRGRKPWLPGERVRQVITQVVQPPKVGLYLNPPDKALVLCCNEKSRCQALERTQPGLPLGIGHIRTQTHDYRRHGTITLFAALNYLDGKILARTEKHHTHVEWLRFLKQIEQETPKELELHLIADNYATHKHRKVRPWLTRHPRFTIHFTPTGSSWMNLVERFFADLTVDCVRDGSFQSVRDLIEAIDEFLAVRNEQPKRYVWRAKGEDILRKIERARAVLNRIINS